MFGALGVKVTVVDQRDRTLDFLDGEIGEAFQYLLRRANVTFRFREKVEAIESVDGRARIKLASGKEIVSETVLYAVGRQGATDELGIEKTGLEADKRGRLTVDDNFRTSVPHIFAVGDVAGGGLAATAMEQGRIAALHAFDQPVTTLHSLAPTGIYAIPEIGMVGSHRGAADGLLAAVRHGHRALERAGPRPDDRRRGRDAEDAGGPAGPLRAGRARDRHRRDGAGPHRPGRDGPGPRRPGLPRHRRLQLPDVRGVLQGRRARRGQPHPRHDAPPRTGRARRPSPPSSTSSPGAKPSASSAAITPMRRSRCSTSASASSFSMSWRAIRRSTASPVTRNSPSPTRSTVERAPRGRAEDLELGDLVLPGGLQRHRLGGRHAPQQLARELVQPLPRRAGGDEHRHALPHAARATAATASAAASGVDEVGLGEREHARERGQPRVVLGQLALDHGVVGVGVGAVERREVEHVDEQPRALDVREEVVAEPGAVARALDQPGDVGDARAGGRRPRASPAPARAS